jgi:hypothetical protein
VKYVKETLRVIFLADDKTTLLWLSVYLLGCTLGALIAWIAIGGDFEWGWPAGALFITVPNFISYLVKRRRKIVRQVIERLDEKKELA